jgi:hypothetical protein
MKKKWFKESVYRCYGKKDKWKRIINYEEKIKKSK